MRLTLPLDVTRQVFDVIVIGTGMGGATAGYQLAKAGRRVLFLEKGPFIHAELEGAPDGLRDSELVHGLGARFPNTRSGDDAAGYGSWPHRARLVSNIGNLDFSLPIGCGTGGSTINYAAGLERFSPVDFAPRANFPSAEYSSLPDTWPITYDELCPYYEQAETLFGVRGTQDPLFQGGASVLSEPFPISATDEELQRSLQAKGLHPYRVHAGFKGVPGCDGCPTSVCARRCKSDSAWVCLVPALMQHGARIMADCEVVRLESDESRVTAVHCRRGGQAFTLQAEDVVLAAGALSTPVLLLKSASRYWPTGLANVSGLVGRNLMFHAGDFIALRGSGGGGIVGPRKSLALNDFYVAGEQKLGTFQMLGVSLSAGSIVRYLRDSSESTAAWWSLLSRPVPVWWRKLMSPLLRIGAEGFCRLNGFSGAPIWASILEDLPYEHNRVYPDPDDPANVVMEYQFSDELRMRIELFRKLLKNALGEKSVFVLSPAYKIDYPHASGTCRFGEDPRESVLNRNNRAHGLENLHIVDASFFPSSAGTNPSLTIAANALRVADVISQKTHSQRDACGREMTASS